MLYKNVVAPLLFKLDPEKAHHLTLSAAGIANIPGIPSILSKIFAQPAKSLERIVMGLKFKSPVCIAAGLDKNCEAFDALACTGVGAIELGTVTPLPQAGNPRPRIFRFPESRSLINRLGFPSCGLTEFTRRLERIERQGVIVGVNIGKNKDTPIEEAEGDYARCSDAVGALADYIAINVSSPNTPGLRALQTPEMLSRIVRAVHNHNKFSRPIVVKMSPDCTHEQVIEFVDCCISEKIAGIVATNTTVWRPNNFPSAEIGGLSGELLSERAEPIIKLVCDRAAGRISIIGAGGIAGADQVHKLLDYGCAATQLYTALVFEGPGLISRINRELELFSVPK